MTVILSDETQVLLADRMAALGHATADEAIRQLLDATAEPDGDLADLDPETLAAIAEGEAQADRGEGVPWQTVRAELEARYNVELGR